MQIFRSRILTLVAALPLAVAATVIPVAPAAAAGCLASGTDADINAALAGPGAVAELCPGAVFNLNNRVTLSAPFQRLTTQGQPTDGSRALLRIANPSLTNAVWAMDQTGAVIEHIRVDGMGVEFGTRSGSPLIVMGGTGTDQTMRRVAAGNTRGWPMLHLFEGPIVNTIPACQRNTVIDNELGPTTFDYGTGIMLACGNSLVQGNLIRDPTDTGITVFGAPGTLVRWNTIVAETQQLAMGIAIADFAPMGGNSTGTAIDGNTIDARGNFIKVGMALGPRVYGWCDGPAAQPVHGATVTNNTLQGQFMGYGIAVAGVVNFNIGGNIDRSRHVGQPTPGCGGPQPLPGGFLYHPQHTVGTSLQAEFRPGNVSDVVLKTFLPFDPGFNEVPGGGAMLSAPAAVTQGGQGNLFIRGTDDRIYQTSWTLAGWSGGWSEVPGNGFTQDTPAAAVLGSSLFAFVRGGDRIYVNRRNSTLWTGWGEVPGNGFTNDAPAAAVLGSNLYAFVRGTDDLVYVNRFNGSSWTGWGAVPGSGFTQDAPAAVAYEGNLYLFTRDDTRIYVNVLYGGSFWGGRVEVDGNGAGVSAPAAAASTDHGINLVVRGADNAIYLNRFHISTWSGWGEIPNSATPDAPGVALISSQLSTFVRGFDNKIYVNQRNL
ncbi:MAG TPA: hypothetical protein VFC19_05020 [Candidatus Limnocylindrales bacterium]|nr:hypothetical protein [Candidatus Limnocylindrales bacterium]